MPRYALASRLPSCHNSESPKQMTDSMTNLRREVTIRPGYDLRGKGPKDFGIAGCNIYFYVHGPKGTVQLVIMTDWYPESARKTVQGTKISSQENKPWITDVGYHSKEPHYEGQRAMDCHILGTCYYDGTSLNNCWEEGLINGGTEWLWSRLEQQYRAIFDGGDYPDLSYSPVPYPEGK